MSFEDKVAEWSDEKALERMYTLLSQRVSVSVKFVQNEDSLITHNMLVFQSGDKFFTSTPQELEWPLQPMPVPEAFKKKVN